MTIRLGRQRPGEGKARRLGQRRQFAAAFFGQGDATDGLQQGSAGFNAQLRCRFKCCGFHQFAPGSIATPRWGDARDYPPISLIEQPPASVVVGVAALDARSHSTEPACPARQ